MEDEYTDTVVLDVMDAERRVCLSNWTPSGAYDALMEAVLQAGVDLDNYSHDDTVGRATVTEDGEVISFTTDTECDHSDTGLLVDHDDNQDWPVVFDEKPKAGIKQLTRCRKCGETVVVYYRQEEIAESDGNVVWERDC